MSGRFDPGLCGSCRLARLVTSDRGTVFWRCGLADADPRYAKYPRLPVMACEGWEDKRGGGKAGGREVLMVREA